MGIGDKVKKAQGWLQLTATIFAFVSSIWVGMTALTSKVESVAYKSDLTAHDANKGAHPYLISLYTQCEAKNYHLEQVLAERDLSLVEITAHLVRVIAADKETKPALRAMASSYYENLFRQKVRRHVPLEDALRETLRSPWYGRPR